MESYEPRLKLSKLGGSDWQWKDNIAALIIIVKSFIVKALDNHF